MSTFIMTVHILVSLFLIVVVLLQAGKGASIGATFGGGGQTLFGSSQGSFIGKMTTAVAIIFMLTSLTLAYLSSTASTSSVMIGAEMPAQVEPVEAAGAQDTMGAEETSQAE